MVTLPAHLVATPVLERLAGGRIEGVVLGAGATAAWVDVDGFVVAVTTREVPLLPNAIALSAGSGALSHPGVGPGTTARLTPGRVTLGPLQITWNPSAPPAWDPTVPVPTERGAGGGGRPRSGDPPRPRVPPHPDGGPGQPGSRAGPGRGGHRGRPGWGGRADAAVPGGS